MKVLSIIIPAYNSEQFLRKGIPSFLSLEVLDKLDIIIVNDGSKDDTRRIAEEYSRCYPDSIRVISQENKGHGGALNTGCAVAVGKYLKPVDADDWVETQNLPELVKLLESCDSNVVLTNYYMVNISTNQVTEMKCVPPAYGEPFNLETVMTNWRRFNKSFTYHGLCYKTAFYQEYGIKLSEHVFYEDHEFAIFPCCYTDFVTALDLFVYDYRIGDVNQSVSNANMLKRISHLETVLSRLIQEAKKAQERIGKGGSAYAVMKIHEFLLSCLTTTLLIEKDRVKGRAMAKKFTAMVKEGVPQAYDLAKWKYCAFLMMNVFHIDKEQWERFVKSKLYRAMRGN